MIIATDRVKPIIKRLAFEICGVCNYKCTCCPQSIEGGREAQFNVMNSFKSFVELLDQIDGLEVVNLEGSGEPTLNKELPLYIAELTRRGIQSFIYTNGYKFKGKLLRDCLDAGLSLVRFSIMGYDRESYKKYMGKDAWDSVLENVQSAVNYSDGSRVGLYHLILDDNKGQLDVYKNLASTFGTHSEVWKPHNWSGALDTVRKGKKKTCGRPFAPDLNVRANNQVVPCSSVLGKDASAVLGDLNVDTLHDILNNNLYSTLKLYHSTEQFDIIDYCKDCDFLYDDNSVLVYTNMPNVKMYQMKGVSFSLNEYRDNSNK